MKTHAFFTAMALLVITGASAQSGELVSVDPETQRAYYSRTDRYTIETDGTFSGNIVAYYEDGSTEEVGALTGGEKDGNWVKYNQNGDIIATARYKQGMKDGVWKVWDGEGNLRMTMYFDDGKRTGTWKIFGPDGKVLDEKNYK